MAVVTHEIIMFGSRLPNLKLVTRQKHFSYLRVLSRKMETQPNEIIQSITEGLACIKTSGKVFYNPVQEFNRDLRLGFTTYI